jgi:excisionase family DNA binding protein
VSTGVNRPAPFERLIGRHLRCVVRCGEAQKGVVVVGVRRLALDVSEVAELLGVSEWLVRKLVADGELPRVAGVGDRILVPRRGLERWVNRELTV